MIADPEFRAACSKRGFMLDPGTGEEMDAIVRDTLGLSPSVAAKIGDMIK
jgi:hypothetical protein